MEEEDKSQIIPVILAGGSGTRLWPLSRRQFPKQFLKLIGNESLLQATAKRVQIDTSWQKPWVVCNQDHQATVKSQLGAIGITDNWTLIEPAARNTAPAIAAAAFHAQRLSPGAILFILPADHDIALDESYEHAISAGIVAAAAGKLVTFGIQPSHPETGYGYIKEGEEYLPLVRKVDQFVEKPDLEKAKHYIETGGYYWNSGMFMFRADQFLDEMQIHNEDVAIAAAQSVINAEAEGHTLLLDGASFQQAPNISVDYALMEKTENGVLVASAFDWSDIGSWDAVHLKSVSHLDENSVVGPVFSKDANGSVIRSFGPFVAAIGVTDLIILATDDAVLVMDRHRSQETKDVVEHLKDLNRTDLLDDAVPALTGANDCRILATRLGRGVNEVIVPAGSGQTQKPAIERRCEHGIRLVVTYGDVAVEVDNDVQTLSAGNTLLVPEDTFYYIQNLSLDDDAAILEVIV